MQIAEMNEKIECLLQELTLEEKIGMIHGAGLFRTEGVERLHISPLKMSDGPMGVRPEFQDDCWVAAGTSDDYVTYCPSNSAIAMTWNKEIAAKAGKVLGEEARGRGKDVILGPGINIKRFPLCGRNFEYFSEDPFLIASLVVPFIQGVESADVAACVKHFALNNQETERLWVNVEIDERALREIYLPGFEAAVKDAGSKSIMAAYNLLHGEHCCHHQELLGTILREEWQYDGMIVSDWGGVHDTKKAAESPLDIEMSVTYDFDEYWMANPLLAAVKAGEIDESYIDEKIRNILRLMFRLKMIEAAVEISETGEKSIKVENNQGRSKGSYNTKEHRESVLEAARESIVLLKNEEKILPLQPEKLTKLLVIGDNAAKLHAFGGGSAEIKALYEISPLMGLKCQLGGNCDVKYIKGYYVPDQKETDHNWQEDSLEDNSGTKENRVNQTEREEQIKLKEEAVKLAAEYEYVIYVGGLNHEEDVEGYDRSTMTLPYAQDELIEELLKVNPNMIVVMMAGNPVTMKSWADQAKSLVWYGYSGMEGGTALAEVLLGVTNPSGKLAETIPYCMEDTGVATLGEFPGRPLTEEENAIMQAHLTESYNEGIFVGYRYYEKYNVPVQFSFGHGLSYTEFAYSDTAAEWKQNENGTRTLQVTVNVANTGDREGKETVQLYVGEKCVREENPVKELKGFEKILLKPGETQKVTIEVPETDLRYFDAKQHSWQPKKGNYVVSLGSSLVDIRQEVEVAI